MSSAGKKAKPGKRKKVRRVVSRQWCVLARRTGSGWDWWDEPKRNTRASAETLLRDVYEGEGEGRLKFLHGLVKSTRAKIEPGDLARVKPAMAILGAASRLRATECNRLAIERAIGAGGSGMPEIVEGKTQKQLKG